MWHRFVTTWLAATATIRQHFEASQVMRRLASRVSRVCASPRATRRAFVSSICASCLLRLASRYGARTTRLARLRLASRYGSHTTRLARLRLASPRLASCLHHAPRVRAPRMHHAPCVRAPRSRVGQCVSADNVRVVGETALSAVMQRRAVTQRRALVMCGYMCAALNLLQCPATRPFNRIARIVDARCILRAGQAPSRTRDKVKSCLS